MLQRYQSEDKNNQHWEKGNFLSSLPYNDLFIFSGIEIYILVILGSVFKLNS